MPLPSGQLGFEPALFLRLMCQRAAQRPLRRAGHARLDRVRHAGRRPRHRRAGGDDDCVHAKPADVSADNGDRSSRRNPGRSAAWRGPARPGGALDLAGSARRHAVRRRRRVPVLAATRAARRPVPEQRRTWKPGRRYVPQQLLLVVRLRLLHLRRDEPRSFSPAGVRSRRHALRHRRGAFYRRG